MLHVCVKMWCYSTIVMIDHLKAIVICVKCVSVCGDVVIWFCGGLMASWIIWDLF